MTTVNLAECPIELLALDPNAEILWPIFLKRVGLHFNAAGRVIEDEGRRADIVRRFGVQSLIQRLPIAKGEVGRARVWWRESLACSDGESDLPDLTAERLYVTNAFIVRERLKFPDPRVARLQSRKSEVDRAMEREVRRGRPRKSIEAKRATEAARKRRNRALQRASFRASNVPLYSPHEESCPF